MALASILLSANSIPIDLMKAFCAPRAELYALLFANHWTHAAPVNAMIFPASRSSMCCTAAHVIYTSGWTNLSKITRQSAFKMFSCPADDTKSLAYCSVSIGKSPVITRIPKASNFAVMTGATDEPAQVIRAVLWRI